MENLYHKTAKIGGYAAVAPLTDHQLLENAVHLIVLPLPTGMHITLYCNVRAGMPQQFAQRFYVAACL